MNHHISSRRKFIKTGALAAAGSATIGLKLGLGQQINRQLSSLSEKHVVSIVRIVDGNIKKAVEEAVDLLGGIQEVTKDKERIMLKPNLVTSAASCTTKPGVIKALAQLMKSAGKEVWIGEGSAAVVGFNANAAGESFRTRNREILDNMQAKVFEELGYQELAASLKVPLINLHSGEIVDVPIPDGYVFNSLKLHQSLTEIDLLCSVPMMKTHSLATVTLAMKNMIGLYPGTEYYSVRAWLHDRAAEAGSPGIAYEILDMVRANKTGLSVIDASAAMEGQGPTDGTLVDMNLIIAGTSPLATDLVGAKLMGFDQSEVPALILAREAGMTPYSIEDIEIRGLNIEQASRNFTRPIVLPWNAIRDFWGVKEI